MKIDVLKIIEKLNCNGCFISDAMKSEIECYLQYDTLENRVVKEIKQLLAQFCKCSDNGVSVISLAIVLPNREIIVSADTGNHDLKRGLFDVASITKFFMLKLVYEFEQKGYLCCDDSIHIYTDRYPEIGDYSILDIIRMYGLLWLDKRLAECSSEKEFYDVLNGVRLEDYRGSASNYTDIGFIILGQLLSDIYYQKTGNMITLDILMKKFVFEPNELTCTMYCPDKNLYPLYGNGNSFGVVHDMKTRIVNGVSGAAGVFTNMNDLIHVIRLLQNGKFFSQSFVQSIFGYHFVDMNQRYRSYAGIYLKCPYPSFTSYVPDCYSRYSIAHQGFTGSAFVCDFKNKIGNVFLIDALEDGASQKKKMFLRHFHELKERIAFYTLLLMINDKVKNQR